MNQTLRLCFKGIAYVYHHQDDRQKQLTLDNLLKQAWTMGYPRSYFDNPSNLTDEILVEDMTDWETKYIFRE